MTDLGYRQAGEVARRIAALFQPELVIASPYLRARETARVIAEALKLPLEIEPLLYERDVGVYQGRSYDSIRIATGYDARSPWLWKPEGGESYLDVRSRVGPILDRLAGSHVARDVVIVSHGGVMQTFWAHVTGDWANIHVPPNCGVVLIEYGASGYSIPKILGKAYEATDVGG
jgi:broad specificity phosphatase PhoE